MPTMNCDEYRERISADPSETFDGGTEHVASCDACRGYRDGLRRFDERIARALAIDVPPVSIPDLSRDETVVDLEGRRERRNLLARGPAWIAIAASVALAFFLTFRDPGTSVSDADLAAEVVAHMDHEQASRRVTSDTVPPRVLQAVLEPEVRSFDLSGAPVTYARNCIINGNSVPHLVAQGESGPITLILLPDESIKTAIPLEGESVHGVLLPVGDGSIAVIGEREQQMPEIGTIGRQLAGSVEWRI